MLRNSTINIGIPPEELTALNKLYGDLSETQKKLIAELEQKLALNQRQVQAALTILGEANIPPEHLGSKLVEVAERFKDLRATASPQTGDDPKIAALKIDDEEGDRCRQARGSGRVFWRVSRQSRGALSTALLSMPPRRWRSAARSL